MAPTLASIIPVTQDEVEGEGEDEDLPILWIALASAALISFLVYLEKD